ncbi:galactose oxidase [Aureococcus anophagefferens]|nr:galactose oxidase [Aureococcus anophagefferens]
MLKLALTALAAAFARGRGECFSDPGVAISADECACHATCETCGYAADPSGRADCVTCADGSKVREVYTDGTGICAGDDLAEICEDTCASANDGACDDGFATRFAGESACPCGSDCGDCGARTPQACADAARDAAVDEAEDAADGAVETVIEEIFCAAAAANRAGGGPPAPGWLSNPNAPLLYVDPLAPLAKEASYVMHSQHKYDGPDGEPTTPAAVAGPSESTTDILGAQSCPAESTADIPSQS